MNRKKTISRSRDYSIRILQTQLDSLRSDYERAVSVNHGHENDSQEMTKFRDMSTERMKELEGSIKILQEFNFKELAGS